VPRPGNFGFGISHDAEHRRTTINEGKVAEPRYIFVFGGSTAYDSGNRDPDTWSSRLSALLGENFAVENYGVPAYSSLENMIQSLFVFRDRPPACAIYYEGWNDLRNSHVKNLRNDYSDMELPHIADFLQPARPRSFLGTYSIFFALAGSLFAPPPPAADVTREVSDQPDPRLSRIYQDNIELIAIIGRRVGVRVIFLPQVLNYAQLTADSAGALPFVKQKDTKKLMTLLNEDLARAARRSGADFIEAKGRETIMPSSMSSRPSTGGRQRVQLRPTGPTPSEGSAALILARDERCVSGMLAIGTIALTTAVN